MSINKSKNIKKTRKEHACWGCCKTIPSGSSAGSVITTEDGSIETIYYCESCVELMNEYALDGDEFAEGEVAKLKNC